MTHRGPGDPASMSMQVAVPTEAPNDTPALPGPLPGTSTNVKQEQSTDHGKTAEQSIQNVTYAFATE